MPRMYHLPPGVKLPPGTPVKITHSDCKGKQIIENATVLADGVSTRSSLPVKILACMKISWWKTHCSSIFEQSAVHYSGSVSTRSLCRGKRCIALCNKSEISKELRYKYAATVNSRNMRSLAEDINTPFHKDFKSDLPKPQPSTSSADQQEATSTSPQPSTSSAGQQEAVSASLQPTSSSQTAPTPEHKILKKLTISKVQNLPSKTKLPPGTPVRITHSNCRGKKIYETSFVGEDGISTRSSLPVKLLADMRITWWKTWYFSDSIQQKICYSGKVSTKNICTSKRDIALCNKSDIPIRKRHKYASCANSAAKSLAETINAPQGKTQQPIPAEPQPSTSSAGQQEAASASLQPTSSSQTASTPKQPT